jgi:DNA repair ATPase RecN
MAADTIEVESLGPIQKQSIPLPRFGGIVVLRGRNGVGKSETLEAINKLAGRNADTPTPLDGHDRGSIEGLGIRLTVGRTTRRTGELEVYSLDSQLSVADVVDPGIKDPAAADEKRMKAILAILQAKVRPQDWMGWVDTFRQQSGFDLSELLKAEMERTSDVLVLASRVKAELSRMAGKEEEIRDEAKATTRAILADPDVANLDPEKPMLGLTTLAEALSRATSHADALTSRKADAGKAEEYQRELEELLARGLNAKRAAQAVEENAAALEKAQKALAALEKSLTTAQADLVRAKLTEKRIKELEGMITTATPPTDEELAEAARVLGEARAAVRQHENYAALAERRKRADEEALRAVSRDARAKALRHASHHPEAILVELVKARLEGVTFSGGRLLVQHPRRGTIQFAELSTGERWRFAIQVAIAGVAEQGERALIVIPQDAWQDLDPPNRTKIAKLAKAANVVIITAECSDDRELTPALI